jgi:hypothetical protein
MNKNINGAIISNVENTDRALNYNPNHGPYFGQDIVIWSENQSSMDYTKIRCKKKKR